MGINGHIILCEDYVSFEIAKLLKEKGFDWECIGYYVNDEPDDVKYSFCGETNSTWESRCCSAPTIQMACKWLREEHNIFILVEPHIYDYINEEISSYVTSLWKRDNYYENVTSKDYPTYEEAVEATIKHCIENLI